MTDEHLAKLTTYYTYHDIANKLILTFSDFVTCVDSGRWAEYLHGQKTLLDYQKNVQYTPRKDIEIKVGSSGYEVHELFNGVTTITTFGVGDDSRIRAFKYYQKCASGDLNEALLCI